MKYPKIFYNNFYITFGKETTFLEYEPEVFLNFLKEPKSNLLLKVEDQQSYHWVWKEMLKILVPIEAAGGLIQNLNGEYLMIYRNNRWDLPKGKMDAGESPEEAALREIEEEVHLKRKHLNLNKFIGLTYHIYPLNGEYMIKSTYWYEVICTTKDYNLKPQIEENITDIQWFKKEELLKINTFASIKSVIELYFQ